METLGAGPIARSKASTNMEVDRNIPLPGRRLRLIEGNKGKEDKEIKEVKRKVRRRRKPYEELKGLGGGGGGARNEHGLTERQERFARAVLKHGILSKAYREAYSTEGQKDQTVWTSAYELSQHPRVKARLEELRREKERGEQHDAGRIKEFVIERLGIEAETAENASARIRALELLGKLTEVGAFTERVEQGITQHQSAAEIEADLKESLERLLDTESA